MRSKPILMSVLALACLTASANAGGTLKGRFVWDGDVPSPDAISITKDVEVCGKHDLVDESLVINPSNNGVAGVAIYISPAPREKEPKPDPSYKGTADAKIRLDNVNCRFEPHVLCLRTSQTLVIGNKDPIGHNSQIVALKNPSQNPMIPANEELEFQFKNEEKFPVTVKCSIHPWMTAYILIKDSPYMTVTDKDGNFEIPDLPEGSWSFQAWNGKYVSSVTVDGKKTSWRKGRFTQKIEAGDNDMGEIVVNAATFK